MTKKQALIRGGMVVVVILSISAGLIYLQNAIGLDKIRSVIAQAGPAGPIIYIFLHLLTHIFAPIQGSPLLILALAIWGKWAIVLSYLVSVISSFTNFWIARKLGRDIVVKLVGTEAMSKIDHLATHEGPRALVIMRLFQGWISDFISYAAGLTSINSSLYYLISVLVPIPWTVAFFLLFDRLDYLPIEQLFSLLLLMGGLMFVIPPTYYFFKHRFNQGKIKHLD